MQLNHCPACGGKLKKDTESLSICKNCSRHIYNNPKPTSAAILENNKGEILLIRRAIPPKKDSWGIPGGFIDIRETAEESLRRESKEEIGVEIEAIRYFGSYLDRYLYQGVNYHILDLIFTAKLKSTNLKPADDAADYAFFAPDEIPFNKIGFRGIRKALEDYISVKAKCLNKSQS